MSDDPIGWKIVAAYDDGSVLCEAPNGKRRRYQFVGKPDESGIPPLYGNVYPGLERTVCTSSMIVYVPVNSYTGCVLTHRVSDRVGEQPNNWAWMWVRIPFSDLKEVGK